MPRIRWTAGITIRDKFYWYSRTAVGAVPRSEDVVRLDQDGQLWAEVTDVIYSAIPGGDCDVDVFATVQPLTTCRFDSELARRSGRLPAPNVNTLEELHAQLRAWRDAP
jgi:hypothetical protein